MKYNSCKGSIKPLPPAAGIASLSSGIASPQVLPREFLKHPSNSDLAQHLEFLRTQLRN